MLDQQAMAIPARALAIGARLPSSRASSLQHQVARMILSGASRDRGRCARAKSSCNAIAFRLTGSCSPSPQTTFQRRENARQRREL
jgi:hypothetical protein